MERIVLVHSLKQIWEKNKWDIFVKLTLSKPIPKMVQIWIGKEIYLKMWMALAIFRLQVTCLHHRKMRNNSLTVRKCFLFSSSGLLTFIVISLNLFLKITITCFMCCHVLEKLRFELRVICNIYRIEHSFNMSVDFFWICTKRSNFKINSKTFFAF